MTEKTTRHRKGDNSIPPWGWVVVLSFLVVIIGTILHLKGTIPSIVAKLKETESSPAKPKVQASALPEVTQEDDAEFRFTLIKADSLILIAQTRFLAKCAESGFILPQSVDYYLGCSPALDEIKNRIRKLPLDDPRISEARSHLVEMSIGVERMLQCFEETDSVVHGNRSFRLPSANQWAFAHSARSVIDHFQRLELACPE